MNDNLYYRGMAVLVLLCLLTGLFVWAGYVMPFEPDSQNNIYPGVDQISENPDHYLGDAVVVGGTVVETNPVVVRSKISPDEYRRFVLEGFEGNVEPGDLVRSLGTLEAKNRIAVTNSLSRSPADRLYAHIVSFLGGVLVLGRLINGWKIDREVWTVQPRKESLLSFGD